MNRMVNRTTAPGSEAARGRHPVHHPVHPVAVRPVKSPLPSLPRRTRWWRARRRDNMIGAPLATWSPSVRSVNFMHCPECGTEHALGAKCRSGPDLCPPNNPERLDADGADARGAHLISGTLVGGQYRLLRKLGEGGMGCVFLAEHLRIPRKSAIKVIRPALADDPDTISRFYREAENASRVSHPNAAAIYDFGQTGDGTLYLAMEYVEGERLSKLVERSGALSPRRAAEIAYQAAEALAAAHDLGIVHRDVKPDNLLVTAVREGVDLVKVVDFGLAKAGLLRDQMVTGSGVTIGTPAYMSPEQLMGDPVDARTDVYSLALTAFYMLTGELPFPDGDTPEGVAARLTGRPRRLSEVWNGMHWSEGIEAVLAKALSTRPAKRYARVTDFA